MNKNWMRAGAALAAAGALTVGMAGTAAADDDKPTVGTPASEGGWMLQGGEGSAFKQREAGQISLTFDNGQAIPTYCIDANTDLDVSHQYAEGAWDESNVKNLGEVAWVLHNSYPTQDPADLAKEAKVDVSGLDEGALEQAAYTATQGAVWSFTDGFVIDTEDSTSEDEAVDKAVAGLYSYLTENAEPIEEPSKDINLDGPETINTSEKAGPFTLDSAGDAQLKAEGAKVVDENDEEIDSVSPGQEFYLLPEEDASEVSLEATSEVSTPTGSVFLSTGEPVEAMKELKNNESQKLILGKQAPGKTGATFTFETEDASTLPVTGGAMTTALVAGAVLLVAGAGLTVMLRRRKVAATWGDA